MAVIAGLTSRDLDLVVRLACGHTTDRVAREFRLSRHTIRERISLLLGRLNCKNRAELVAYCYAHGVLATGVWPPAGRLDRRADELYLSGEPSPALAPHLVPGHQADR